MKPQELIELKERVQAACTYNREVANAGAHAAALETVAGPVSLDTGLVKHSAAHLLALIEKVERVRAGGVPDAAPLKESKPKKKKKAKESDEPEGGPSDDAEDGPSDDEPEE
jgi:hypothetical protein